MHWNAGPIFSDTCAIPTARPGVYLIEICDENVQS